MYSADNLVPSFQDALESYKDGFMSIRNLAEKSRIDYETDVIIFLNFLQGRGVTNLSEVTPKHIHAYLSWQQRKPSLIMSLQPLKLRIHLLSLLILRLPTLVLKDTS